MSSLLWEVAEYRHCGRSEAIPQMGLSINKTGRLTSPCFILELMID